MPNYLTQVCQGCGKQLRVRAEYLGRWVTCRYCEHAQLISTTDESSSILEARELTARGSVERETNRRQEPLIAERISIMEERMEQLRMELAEAERNGAQDARDPRPRTG